METGLTLRRVDSARVLAHLGRINAPRSDTSAGVVSAEEICRDGDTYAVEEGGQPVAAYNLQVAEHERGRVAWVMAAGGGRAGVDLTRLVVPAIEAQARALGACQIALNTRRKGLIHKLQKLGFEVTSVTLRKNLK